MTRRLIMTVPEDVSPAVVDLLRTICERLDVHVTPLAEQQSRCRVGPARVFRIVRATPTEADEPAAG